MGATPENHAARYLLWRRIVRPRVAALISTVRLIVPGLTETYAWIVLAASCRGGSRSGTT